MGGSVIPTGKKNQNWERQFLKVDEIGTKKNTRYFYKSVQKPKTLRK